MIVCVNGSERDLHMDLVQEMYRQRARVFKDRMGWDVEVRDGMEIDKFDEENPLYLISVDEGSGRLRGSLRLLPTTGPNMLRDVFPQLTHGTIICQAGTATSRRGKGREKHRFAYNTLELSATAVTIRRHVYVDEQHAFVQHVHHVESFVTR